MTEHEHDCQYEPLSSEHGDVDSSPAMAKERGQPANRKLLIVTAVSVIIIISLLIAVIVLAIEKADLEKESKQSPSAAEKTPLDLLSHFGMNDGLDVKWFPGIKNSADINTAREGKNHILDVRVVSGSSTAPVIEGGALSVRQFLELVQNDNFVVNFELASNGVVRDVLGELQSMKYNEPVLLSVPVLSQQDSQFNLTWFLETVEKSTMATPFGVNLDLTSACCDDAIGIGLLEFVASIVELASYLVTVEIDAAVLVPSWPQLKWLLDKEDDVKFVISVNSTWNETINYHLLLARNDVDIRRVFYNIGKMPHDEFATLASTAGSPLIYFNIEPRDAGNIIWSHNTDTWELINKATSGDTMMVEGDIRLDPNTSVPIMAHDKGENNNLTFAQWLEELIKVNKGMKLDFKELEAVDPALTIIKQRQNEIKGPIWANADILSGPGNVPVKIPANKFLQAVQKFPGVTLSLGWTTVQKGENYNLNYTMANVEEIHAICKDLPQPVTFPVRAEQSLDSWASFDWLLQQSQRYTLTIWTGKGDNVTKADMDALKRKAEMSRIYFDLPLELRPTIP